MDTANHFEIMKLALSYTFVGIIIFTAVFTVLSWVGITKFANHDVARFMTKVLLAEVVAGGIGLGMNVLEVNFKATQDNIQKPLVEKIEDGETKIASIEREFSNLQAQLDPETINRLRPNIQELNRNITTARRTLSVPPSRLNLQP